MSRRILLVLVVTLCAVGAEMPGEKRIPPPRKVPPRTDRYGDPLPPGAIARLGTARFRHVGDFAFSPDGRTVLLGQRAAFRLCDVATGKVRLTFSLSYELRGEFVAFSPDSRTLAVGNRVVISLHDASSGKELGRLVPAHRGAFAAAGRRFVSWGDDRTVRIWQTATGKLHRKWKLPAGTTEQSIALSADGALLAVGDAHGVRAWEAATGREVKTPPGLRTPMERIKFAPTSRMLFALRADDSAVHVWNLATGKERSIRPPHPPWLIELSPDGNLLAAIERKRWIRLWKTGTGREVGLLDAGEEIEDFAFAPDGRALAVRAGAALGLWDVATRKPLRRFVGQLTRDTIRPTMRFSPDGKVLAGLDGEDHPRLRFWDVARGREIVPPSDCNEVRTLAFSPDGLSIATANCNGLIRLWETATGRPLLRLPGHRGAVSALAFATDGKTLASFGEADGAIRIWDVGLGRSRYHFHPIREGPEGAEPDRCRLRFSGDSKCLASVHLSTSAVVFREALTGKVQQKIPEEGYIRAFALSPDGRTMAVWGNRTGLVGGTAISLWALGARKARPGVSLRIPDKVRFLDEECLAFSPDSRLLAAASETKLWAWEVATGRLVGSFKGRGILGNPVFTPAGQLLVMHSEICPRESLQIWDAMRGKELRRFKAPGQFFDASGFSPDGRFVAGAVEDGTVVIWDLSDLARPGEKRRAKPGAAELKRWWEDLAAADAARGYRAVRALRDAPESAVPFLAGRFVPATAERYPRLIKALDADTFAERQAVVAELTRLGLKAEPALRAVLKGKPSLEVRRRVETLLARLDGPPPAAEVLRQGRALAVLEKVATPAALVVLKRLAAGAPEARLTQDAKAALRRLSKRPSDP